MEYSRQRNTSGIILLVCFFLPLCVFSQRLADSILALNGHGYISANFILKAYSSINGTSITTGALDGYYDRVLHYRLRIDSLKNGRITESVIKEFASNTDNDAPKKIIGCNYGVTLTYHDYQADRLSFQKVVSEYLPIYLSNPKYFNTMFSSTKRFSVVVSRSKTTIFLTITEKVDSTENKTLYGHKIVNLCWKYEVQKSDYTVQRVKSYTEFIKGGQMYHDSTEITFFHSTKTRYSVVGYVWGFKPNKRNHVGKFILPQDTISRIPDFNLMDIEKKLFKSINSKSKFALIVFWNNECFPCRNTINDLTSFAANFDKEFLQFLAINDQDLLDDFMRSNSSDTAKCTYLFNGRYLRDWLFITIHPTIFVIDNKTRKVAYKAKGDQENYLTDLTKVLGILKNN